MPVDPPGPPAPVSSVSVDSNGNLVLNGKPFLLIQATNMDYASWGQAGYTEAQADAKLAQMTQWGYNTLYGNWGQLEWFSDPRLYQDLAAWQRHGLYWHGSATLGATSGGVQAKYWLTSGPDYDAMVAIINQFKGRPNLLLWWLAGEYGDSPLPDTLHQAYCPGVQNLQRWDPTRLAGDTTDDMAQVSWDATLRCMRITWDEATVDGGMESGEALGHLYDALSHLNQAWADGDRFVLGCSTTPIPEIDGPANVPQARLAFSPTAATELHRFFMYQVAMNCRTFDVLWGPNQRGAGVPLGDAMPRGFLDVWNYTGQEINKIKSLRPVILAPGRWQPVTTTPGFVTGVGPTNNSMDGIFAAKKTVDGITYVIACNMRTTQDGVTGHWTENPILSATIDVGLTIRSANKIFENGAVSFSGRFITDSFVPMGVHVYVVR